VKTGKANSESSFWQVSDSGILKHVAQLWQRRLIRFRLTSSVIRKIMHKIGVFGYPMGASGAIYALYLKFLTQRNVAAQFDRENVSFTRKTTN